MNNNKFKIKRVLSGIQPSGKLHIGNYFGMMSRMIEYQKDKDLFCFIVNYHALTTISDQALLKKNTIDAALDFLALGLDPEKSTFWIQSDVPEVTELSWLLSNTIGVGQMERSTSYKDKISKGISPNMGLFSYPVLMAADILLFGGDLVPVGKDQMQHLEIARDIASKFNKVYGNTFIVPEADIEKNTMLVSGTDGKKMSKSYNNIIPIFDSEKILKKHIMSITTDSTPIDSPKDKNTPLFKIYSLFLNSNEIQVLNNKYDSPGLRYGDIKQELFEIINKYFAPYREKRLELENKKSDIIEILDFGAKKAKIVAKDFLELARENMGINY
tara:strand:+ start:884 stop:1870 length:987 start_codon:yes stop_codon:yes gene_type:complete